MNKLNTDAVITVIYDLLMADTVVQGLVDPLNGIIRGAQKDDEISGTFQDIVEYRVLPGRIAQRGSAHDKVEAMTQIRSISKESDIKAIKISDAVVNALDTQSYIEQNNIKVLLITEDGFDSFSYFDNGYEAWRVDNRFRISYVVFKELEEIAS